MDDSETPIDHLVVDSSGFIHNGPIRDTGKNIYSCLEIVDEIKDKQTLERLRFLPYELKLIQFDKDDLDTVVDFAKKTGDYSQLSIVDLKLIAATYKLEKQHNGKRFINTEPKQVDVKQFERQKPSATDLLINDIRSSLKKTVIEDSYANMVVDDADIDAILDKEAELDEEETDDEADSWITPNNIKHVYEKMGVNHAQSKTTDVNFIDRVKVACMTSDFSIQNCLLQMGLLVVSPKDGLMIKEAKKIALRCHACYKVVYDLNKIKNDFCPKCGNLDTLKRVQYVIEEDGSKRIVINFKKQIRVKGLNKQLPMPRGGKHANNPILAPDQKYRRDKKSKFAVQEKRTLSQNFVLEDPAYLVRSNPFAHRALNN